ncbi:MAG: lipopolysaccharide assembly LapA domain-containing protein [Brachymonas sp.]
MQKILWLLQWILKAAIFFTLFAFALNNQHEVVAHFFFGNQWKAPLVVIVLLAFTAGLVVGVLGMLPRWWRRRKAEAARMSSAPALTPSPLPQGQDGH